MLAMAQQCEDTMSDRSQPSLRALRYLTTTYRCINQDLQEVHTPSDPMIAVVMSLLVHENLTYNFGTPKMHLDALERMIELRGGIDHLTKDWLLLHKICRCELDGFDGYRSTLTFQ